jgi:hypothetical protein
MRLDWKVLGLAAGSFLAITYVLCVVFDLVTGLRMYEAWVALLPGFTWISWGSFTLGLVESFGYGIYFGLVFAPLYNLFLVRVWKYAK